MKRLDRFILTSFIGPFLAILLVVTFILMMQFLWLYIDELVGKGLSFSVVAEFLMWGSCTILPLALPLATLLAGVMTLGGLGDNNELTAIKAAGISLSRVLAPLSVVALIISGIAFYAANNLVPLAYNKIYTLRDDIGRTKEEIKIPTGSFYDGIEGYVLRVNARNESTGMMYGVMVYDHSKGRGNTALTLADSAIMKMSARKDFLTFRLYQGINYQETNTRHYRDTTLELQRIRFSRQELVIPLENYAFQKSDDARFGDQVRSMDLEQLAHGRDSIGELNVETYKTHIRNFRQDQILNFHRQLDSAWVAKGPTPYHPEGFNRWDSAEEELEAVQRASSTVQSAIITLEGYSQDSYEYLYLLRRIGVEYLRKFSQALACLLMFFIGAPLGAIFKKGGIGVPAIIAVLFFVLYWVVDITGTKLARDGAASATVGAFLSAFILAPLGAWLTWKAVNDSALFHTDSLAQGWRRIRSHIASLFRKTRIVYMGTPEFAVAPLEALLAKRHKVVGVVTVADKPVGRGQKVSESAVKRFAVAHGIPVLQPLSLKDPAFLEALAAWKADLFVVVAFRMLPEVVWSMPRLGTINLHAALLPQYRGAAPINWALINGEKMTGVTTFMIDRNIDTGGIILRQECRIREDDNAGTLHDRLQEIGKETVCTTVEGLIEHNVDLRVQKSFIQGDERLKSAPKLTRELLHIDWDAPTKDIRNLIRGLSPYPAAFTELVPAAGGAPVQLKVFAATAVIGDAFRTLLQDFPGVGTPAPGTLLSDGKTFLAVTTADGALYLDDIQLAGKKRMATAAFLAGFRDPMSYGTTRGTSRAEIEKTRV